jgi:hypothetical protein
MLGIVISHEIVYRILVMISTYRNDLGSPSIYITLPEHPKSAKFKYFNHLKLNQSLQPIKHLKINIGVHICIEVKMVT